MPDDAQAAAVERLEALKHELVEQGGRVQRLVEAAVEAIFEKDAVRAAAVRAGDDEIDRVDVRIEREAVSLLTAAMSPTSGAGPLDPSEVRMVLTIVKVNNEFERIADLAVAMVSRIESFVELPEDPPPRFRVMANSVVGILQYTVRTFDQMDVLRAQEVLASDDTTEAFRDAILRESEAAIAEGQRSADYAFTLNRTAAALARIADHCTNTAEQIIYVRTGKIVRHLDEHWTEPEDPDLGD